MEINFENMAGEYSTPEGYFVADHKPEEFASFERQFPAK